MNTTQAISQRGRADFSAQLAIVMRDANRLLPFRTPRTSLMQRSRFTLHVNGCRIDGNFDRLVDAVQAIQGRPLGNNYEIYSGERRVFTFGVCLRTARQEAAVAAIRPVRMRPFPELS